RELWEAPAALGDGGRPSARRRARLARCEHRPPRGRAAAPGRPGIHAHRSTEDPEVMTPMSTRTAAPLLRLAAPAAASDVIPAAAWKRPMGLPLPNPGKEKPSIQYPHIDDGYWQGAPV